MLTAYKEGKITLDNVIKLMHDNPRQMFNLPTNNDIVFANIEDYYPLTNEQLCTKVKWTPYVGMNLTGYPEYLFIDGKLINLQEVKA